MREKVQKRILCTNGEMTPQNKLKNEWTSHGMNNKNTKNYERNAVRKKQTKKAKKKIIKPKMLSLAAQSNRSESNSYNDDMCWVDAEIWPIYEIFIFFLFFFFMFFNLSCLAGYMHWRPNARLICVLMSPRVWIRKKNRWNEKWIPCSVCYYFVQYPKMAMQ